MQAGFPGISRSLQIICSLLLHHIRSGQLRTVYTEGYFTPDPAPHATVPCGCGVKAATRGAVPYRGVSRRAGPGVKEPSLRTDSKAVRRWR